MPTLFESSEPKKRASQAAGKSAKAAPGQSHSSSNNRMNPLTCFAVNPFGVRFETQEDEEVVVLFLRQHFIANTPWIILAIVLLISPAFLFPLLLPALNLSAVVPTGFVVVGTLLWYLVTFGYILAKFLGWYFNIYIVTNERLVDIDFYYLLYKHFSEADLSKIQDISYTASGILSTIFNFGTVVVETAGESPNLEFDMVPRPDKVVESIRSLVEKRTR